MTSKGKPLLTRSSTSTSGRDYFARLNALKIRFRISIADHPEFKSLVNRIICYECVCRTVNGKHQCIVLYGRSITCQFPNLSYYHGKSRINISPNCLAVKLNHGDDPSHLAFKAKDLFRLWKPLMSCRGTCCISRFVLRATVCIHAHDDASDAHRHPVPFHPFPGPTEHAHLLSPNF